ncbi:MAG TPA: helix-turn-helix domain-containing protein [Acidimicrobiales bacterium]|nr:helix-turn-helix domain-containing protein [Acidimicrobiales bacterium]
MEATRFGDGAPADSTRQRLLDAATEVFMEKGYDGTRVAEIARRAGLTTGAIYGNFESKAELLTAALAASCSTQHRLFLDVLALAPRDETAARAVEAALKASSDQIAEIVNARGAEFDVSAEAMGLALELMAVGAVVMQALGRALPSAELAHVLKVAAAVVSAEHDGA